MLADSLDNIDPQLLQAASPKTIDLVPGNVELQNDDDELVEVLIDENVLRRKPANSLAVGPRIMEGSTCLLLSSSRPSI